MSNWLSNRLTPSKIKEARWVEFSTVLEHVWEEFFDPGISRLERLRSAYTADDADLIKKIREMGDYFSFERPKQDDRPVALAWRRLEIEYKDMETILRSVFRRHFGDFPVEWYPLFAPNDQPYGTEFITSDYLLDNSWTKNIPPENYFLTSRGIVGVDKLGLFKDHLSKDNFRIEARPLVIRTKPLHIVFDGFLWFIRYDLGSFAPLFDVFWESEDFWELQFGPVGVRYDYTPADVRHVDADIFQTWSETERPVRISFFPENLWRLDLFLPDGVGDLLPLDLMYRRLRELSLLPPLDILFHESIRSPKISFSSHSCLYSENITQIKWNSPQAHVATTRETLSQTNVKGFVENEFALDRLPLCDEIACDFAPIDCPYGGYV